MENLMFCLNATIPIFMLMILGMFFKKIGLFDENFISRMNNFVFKAALPVLLFQELAGADFVSVWDGGYVLFCFLATGCAIFLSVLISLLWKNRSVSAEFAQASYRSSAALLGIGLITNIYGSAGFAPLMIIGTVPLYNVCAVIILALLKPEKQKLDGALIKKTLFAIVTNPIILGIVVGLGWSLGRLPNPVMLQKTLKYVANLATPLGLMAMGAGFDLKKAFGNWKPACVGGLLKLVVFAALTIPAAVAFGYRADKLVSVLIMMGSPTTVSCFVMAKNMGHEGTVSSSTVMLTTLFSAFTLTAWLYLLRTFSLI